MGTSGFAILSILFILSPFPFVCFACFAGNSKPAGHRTLDGYSYRTRQGPRSAARADFFAPHFPNFFLTSRGVCR
jgi:hypothetical protein